MKIIAIIKKVRKTHLVMLGAAVLLVEAVSFMTSTPQGTDILVTAFMIAFFLSLSFALYLLRKRRLDVSAIAAKAAQLLECAYIPEQTIHIPAVLFHIKSEQRAFDILTKKYRDNTVSIFSYRPILTSPTSLQTSDKKVIEYTVFAKQSAKPWPHMVLLSKLSQGVPVLNSLQKDTLEGPFPRLFNMYVENGAQTTIRELLPPDKMLYVMEKFTDCSIEFVGPYVLIVQPGLFTTTEQYAEFMDRCSALVDTLVPSDPSRLSSDVS